MYIGWYLQECTLGRHIGRCTLGRIPTQGGIYLLCTPYIPTMGGIYPLCTPWVYPPWERGYPYVHPGYPPWRRGYPMYPGYTHHGRLYTLWYTPMVHPMVCCTPYGTPYGTPLGTPGYTPWCLFSLFNREYEAQRGVSPPWLFLCLMSQRGASYRHSLGETPLSGEPGCLSEQ